MWGDLENEIFTISCWKIQSPVGNIYVLRVAFISTTLLIPVIFLFEEKTQGKKKKSCGEICHLLLLIRLIFAAVLTEHCQQGERSPSAADLRLSDCRTLWCCVDIRHGLFTGLTELYITVVSCWGHGLPHKSAQAEAGSSITPIC